MLSFLVFCPANEMLWPSNMKGANLEGRWKGQRCRGKHLIRFGSHQQDDVQKRLSLPAGMVMLWSTQTEEEQITEL